MQRVILATHNEGKLAELRAILSARLGQRAQALDLVTAGSLGLSDPVETGTSFKANALLKARDVAARTGCPAIADDSGLIVDLLGQAPGILSARWAGKHGDDAANNALLLAQLQDIPDEARTARFVCCAALVVPAGRDLVSGQPGGTGSGVGADSAAAVTATPLPGATGWEAVRFGVMRGRLLRQPRGSHGFGYDPLFVPDEQPGQVASGGSEAGQTVTATTSPSSADSVSAAAGSLTAAEPLTSAQMSAEQKNAISHRGKAFTALVEDLARLLG